MPTRADRTDGGAARPVPAGQWTTPEGWRGPVVSVAVVTLLGLVDLSAGRDVVVAGMLTVGPCLAAIIGSPRTVVAVGAYSVLSSSPCRRPTAAGRTRAPC